MTIPSVHRPAAEKALWMERHIRGLISPTILCSQKAAGALVLLVKS